MNVHMEIHVIDNATWRERRRSGEGGRACRTLEGMEEVTSLRNDGIHRLPRSIPQDEENDLPNAYPKLQILAGEKEIS